MFFLILAISFGISTLEISPINRFFYSSFFSGLIGDDDDDDDDDDVDADGDDDDDDKI